LLGAPRRDPLHATRRGFWRSMAGLAILLLAVAARVPDAAVTGAKLPAIAVTCLVISMAWIAQELRPNVVSIGALGGVSAVLMWLQPGTGPVVGAIAAIVTAGARLEVRTGMVVAAVIGAVVLLADGLAGEWNSPISLAFTALGLTFAYVASVSVRRIREERERTQALLVELQRTRDAQIEAAALGERSRIAREIHDVLAHTLSALAVQLEGTRMLLEQRPGDPAAVAAVERAHRLARDGLDETRRAVGALRGDRLPGPAALARLAETFSERAGIACDFSVEGHAVELEPEAQLAVYRTAQEALTNVHKHAQATAVSMRLRYAETGIELAIEDTAPTPTATPTPTSTPTSTSTPTFTSTPTPTATPVSTPRSVSAPGPGRRATGGYGLLGMRERAELLGGTLEAGPVATGFKVRLWLPLR
jgi:signal transduction histidine kinase